MLRHWTSGAERPTSIIASQPAGGEDQLPEGDCRKSCCPPEFATCCSPFAQLIRFAVSEKRMLRHYTGTPEERQSRQVHRRHPELAVNTCERKGVNMVEAVAVLAFAQFSASMNAIVRFNGLDYQDWSEQVKFYLALTGLDLSLNTKEFAALTNKSSQEEKEYHEKWMRSNKMCLNLMKITMAENMKPMMPKVDITSEFMGNVKKVSMSEIVDKSIAGNLMTELTSMKFDWSMLIHDHCNQMANIAAQLKGMGMELSESWLVHLVINSLPPAEFGQFHVNYNTLKEKWSFKETKHLLVQEETRLKKLRHHSIHFTSQGGSSTNKRKPGKKGQDPT
nr:UBN2 domain-containing protein [Ipomoea batatas]